MNLSLPLPFYTCGSDATPPRLCSLPRMRAPIATCLSPLSPGIGRHRAFIPFAYPSPFHKEAPCIPQHPDMLQMPVSLHPTTCSDCIISHTHSRHLPLAQTENTMGASSTSPCKSPQPCMHLLSHVPMPGLCMNPHAPNTCAHIHCLLVCSRCWTQTHCPPNMHLKCASICCPAPPYSRCAHIHCPTHALQMLCTYPLPQTLQMLCTVPLPRVHTPTLCTHAVTPRHVPDAVHACIAPSHMWPHVCEPCAVPLCLPTVWW